MGKATMITIAVGIIVVAGCAGEDAARRLSDTGATLTSQLSGNTQKFFNDQNVLAQAVSESITKRQQDALNQTNLIKSRKATWIAQNNKDACDIFDALTTNTAESLLANNLELQSLHPATMIPAITFDQKPYNDLVLSLKKLATAPTLAERGTFLFKEGKAVFAGYTSALKKGTQTAQTATQNIVNPK